jgi:hypothetical protein
MIDPYYWQHSDRRSSCNFSPLSGALKGAAHIMRVYVPKIRFCNIGDEDRRGQAVM